MLVEPRPNLVVDTDRGFSVQVLGRTGMRYCQDGRCVRINSEVLAVKGIEISAKSIDRWNPPHDTEPIDEETRGVIIAHIRSVMAYWDAALVVAE
ncbi:Immunity protein 74 [Bryocella elongata]|uniref:Immunity protein 74 n=1 Tax=Bryocella elongata TaxID=863522 RepID=A0A1H5ZI42_9BACT|nr:hypothetical protein [Bryocella elongata]SEG36119.1 Immunity protein 74 [Bryocella elongata]